MRGYETKELQDRYLRDLQIEIDECDRLIASNTEMAEEAHDRGDSDQESFHRGQISERERTKKAAQHQLELAGGEAQTKVQRATKRTTAKKTAA